MQGIGYVIGALGPLVVGILRDATGGWDGADLVPARRSWCSRSRPLIVLRRPRYVEDEVGR